MSDNIISIRNMKVEYKKPRGSLFAVNGVDFDLEKGKLTALVGESGSGKSTLAFTILNTISGNGKMVSGEVLFNGENILDYDTDTLNKYKWDKVSMIFQASQNAFNPLMTVYQHFIETYNTHVKNGNKEEMKQLFIRLMEDVRLEPERVLKAYPHELSGGMRQRVMIAFSMMLDPEVIILDEPTTALDVITQDYIFSILRTLHQRLHAAMLLLTHDIGVVAKVADSIAIMYAGKIVEMGDVSTIFKNAAHPYSYYLIKSAPSLLDTGEEKEPIEGSPPDMMDLPEGCPFHPRCKFATELCRTQEPPMVYLNDNHRAMCHYAGKFLERRDS